jgi:four helix bundle protein
MSFNTFEEIKAWQKARQLTQLIYRHSAASAFERDFGLKDQIRRSSVSIMANIAEGQGRRSDREFANFLNIALGSVAETKSHLYIASDLGYVSHPAFEETFVILDEVGKMLFSLSKHLRERIDRVN